MRNSQRMSEERARHWDDAYTGRGVHGVSWYQDAPRVSLELIEALGIAPVDAVIDVGGGASQLADHLLDRGFADVSVLDVSAAALAEAQRRFGGSAASVRWLEEDVLLWRPERRYALWHDRALFHFLVTSEERDTYLQTLRSAIQVDGCVVLATFAPEAPEFCSGLPVVRYSVEELAAVLGSRFELLDARREEHITPRGVTQQFTWVAGRIRVV